VKIYFAASIRGGGIDPETCKELLNHLRGYGRVFTEHICDEAADLDGDWGPDRDIYERDIRWLESADVVVAEVSLPSLGVGYEIGKAEEWGKPILCLYCTNSLGKLSAMIWGNEDLTVKKYGDLSEALALIDDFLKHLPP
jgi:nucleoside 2-deoxyribosyltransferase